jgi:hypothetical protein
LAITPVSGREYHLRSRPTQGSLEFHNSGVQVRKRVGPRIKPCDRRSGGGKSWEDAEGKPIESLLREVVTELLVTGEAYYRAGALAHHEWMIERRAELGRPAAETSVAPERDGRCIVWRRPGRERDVATELGERADVRCVRDDFLGYEWICCTIRKRPA